MLEPVERARVHRKDDRQPLRQLEYQFEVAAEWRRVVDVGRAVQGQHAETGVVVQAHRRFARRLEGIGAHDLVEVAPLGAATLCL